MSLVFQKLLHAFSAAFFVFMVTKSFAIASDDILHATYILAILIGLSANDSK